MDDTKHSSRGVGNSGRDHRSYHHYRRHHCDDSGNATLSAPEKHVCMILKIQFFENDYVKQEIKL